MASYRGNGPVVPHPLLDKMVASSSGGGAGPAFVVGCLALMTRGEATEAMTKGHIVVVTVAAQAWSLLSASCLTLTTRGGATWALSRWQGGSGSGACPAFVAGLLCVEVEDKRGIWSTTGGNRHAQPARTLVEWFWRQNGESFSPAINMCECHTTNENS